ncbi:restriction endonuclease subunit S [Glaesserella parasuis]|uniref:restriction endonuclease subunit S n=1 Tax=Glaesserella parasuis TaxID=738 RepID=UPI0003ABE12C|nr:restriction endonuclease subunit S [Glaesserella parasuis]ATW43244.1 hypothetical protein A2U20_05245 [Glaesserella parasuis D74]EQA10684.1 type I restriction modification DNA specificity domain protein [Glaesserella parasuis D74]MDO9767095.1 restriction endonuclease subunit S [Glaesserella parasuis]MDP0318343.1 restriction endonuclease subunit S [Glaesserella parasuis]
MSNFIRAEEYCVAVKDGTHNSPKKTENGVKLATSKNIIGGNLDLSTAYFISEEDANEVNKRSKVDKNDILISMIGTVGEVCLIKDDPDFVIKNVGLLKNKCAYKAKWLYFYLKTNQAQNLIKERLRGTTQQYLSLGELRNFPVLLPKNEDHLKNAVNILWELEQKIQLNTQINQTLEQIAQTIFKSWFIDFDPVHAKANALANGQTTEQATQAAMAVISGKNTQELHRLQTANPEQYQQLWEIAEAFPSGFDEKGVPRGWSIKYFKDITSLYIDNRGKTPPIEESGIPLLEVKHLPEHSIFPNLKTEKYISDDIYDSWLRQKLEPLDIVISTVGTIGRISLIPFNKKVAIAQNILGFRFKQNVTNQVFMFYQMKSHKFNFDVEARLVETVQKSIKRKDLETIPLIIPDLKLQKFFEKMVLPTILKQDNENETLEKTRDELLPKLLSGELNGLPEKTI